MTSNTPTGVNLPSAFRPANRFGRVGIPRNFWRLLLTCLAVPFATLAAAQAPVSELALCDDVNNNSRMELSKPLLQAQISAKPGTATADFLKGCLLMADDKADKAADQFELATKKESSRSLYFDWLGRAYGDQAQKANKLKQPFLARKTKAAFEQAVKLDPNNLEARNYLVEYYVQAPGFLGGSEEKAAIEGEAIRARNAYRGAFVMSTVKQHRKDIAGAEKEVAGLTKSHPDSVAPWYSVINLQVTAKRWTDAFLTADGLKAAHPTLPVNDYLSGRLAAVSGEQLERGEAGLRKYLTYTPRPGEPALANAHYRLGQVLQKKGSNEAAKAEYREAIRLDPKLEDAKKALAAMK